MTSPPAASVVTTYLSAVATFADLVRRIPPDAWDGPGLGDWDLRSLVGHTSRALVTVREYLDTTAGAEDVASAHGYYALLRTAPTDPAAIVERGRRAGAGLGAEPAAAVDALAAEVSGLLAGRQDRLIAVIGGLGIRLYSYLPTRTFELAVHGLDIATAAGIPLELPPAVLEEAVALAARTAVSLGDGPAVLRALTGRDSLIQGFTVV